MELFNLKPSGSYKYDAVSMGEVMLRLDPGVDDISQARDFRVWEGGGEYNVARGLHKCFGLRTAIITALADNEIGDLLTDLIMQGGVDTSLIRYLPYDGIGRSCRNGLNFTQRGFGARASRGCSDRANSAISQMKPEDFDFDYIFGTLGVRWFHTGGIYAALSEISIETIMTAIKTAKKYGTIVSYDLNYRASQWKDIGGAKRADEVNGMIASQIDVLIGCLGMPVDGPPPTEDDYFEGMKNLSKKYPNLKMITTTTRKVKTASVNDWSALCYAGGEFYKANYYENLDILDRIGGGDSFASGLIYGLLNEYKPYLALDYGVAHGAFAMSTPGDTSMVSLHEVEELVYKNR